MGSPKVSVFMVTFNHEKYIAEAIESVLMQKTNFSIELIVAEDCSKDLTREIVELYAERYPDIVKPIFNSVNLGPQNNFAQILNVCTGTYTAVLDGDDYWVDPQKLQKQADFMDKHPEVSICATIVKGIYENSNKEAYYYPQLKTNESFVIYDIEELIETNIIPTSTVMYRKSQIKEFPDWYYPLPIGDYPLNLLYGTLGKIAILNMVTSTYRQHVGGIYALYQEKNKINILEKVAFMLIHFNEYTQKKYNKSIYFQLYQIMINLLLQYDTSEKHKAKVSMINEIINKWKIAIEVHPAFKSRRLVLFGTGSGALRTLFALNLLDLYPEYCVDNEAKKWGMLFQGVRVFKPEKINDECIVIVGSSYYKEISRQLEKKGLLEGVHFFPGLSSKQYLKFMDTYDDEYFASDLPRFLELISQ